jgi:hypothetical protein|tara:strand:- start:242 stop:373 length:132 start_codon:yes stop_codon:yes gene_type:complete
MTVSRILAAHLVLQAATVKKLGWDSKEDKAMVSEAERIHSKKR